MLAVIGSGATDRGRIRERNEDSFALGDLDAERLFDGEGTLTAAGPRGLCAIVCDGMGGAAGGDVASELAARATWRELLADHATDDPEVFARLLRRAVRVANQRVYEEAEREPSLRGMGTTLSAVGVAGGRLVCAQIGDSRVYLCRAGVLTQLTRDQTLTSALVGAGRDPLEAALAGGSTILQALGVNPDVEPSLSMVPLCRADRVLVCSDGLYNHLGAPTMAAILDSRGGPAAVARMLCDAACAAGGTDNITAVVLDVDGDALPAADPAGPPPRFVEFDPREQGERALTSTSYVVRRLAAQAGIGDDPGPPVVPATGRHPVIVGERLPALAPAAPPAPGKTVRLLGLIAAALIAGALGWWLAG
ncbi:MAG: serine/threonine-protein phosphatase [Myxococcales bacterium]|nr:serine/threonine-protein phosphatase [Myxococcales bacterium]